MAFPRCSAAVTFVVVLLGVTGRASAAGTQSLVSGTTPPAALNSVAQQTPAQRSGIAAALESQIEELRARLQPLLAAHKTPATQAQIAELNEALSVKQEARDLVLGRTEATSRAAQESYAAITSPYFLICKDQLWTPSPDPLKWVSVIGKVKKTLIDVGRSVGL